MPSFFVLDLLGLCALSGERGARTESVLGGASMLVVPPCGTALRGSQGSGVGELPARPEGRSGQTAPTSQMTKHAARAHFLAALLSTNKAPRPTPTQSFLRPAGGMPRIEACDVVGAWL